MLKESLKVWEEKSKELLRLAETYKKWETELNQWEMQDLCNYVLQIETEIYRARTKLEREINYRRFW